MAIELHRNGGPRYEQQKGEHVAGEGTKVLFRSVMRWHPITLRIATAILSHPVTPISPAIPDYSGRWYEARLLGLLGGS